MNTTQQQQHINNSWAWFNQMGSPRHWLAPMVGASEPAFRILCRRYNVNIASTEMVDSGGYAFNAKYRNQFHIQNKSNNVTDRPLIVQLGGANPIHLKKAALAAVPYADAIELNIGCPQQCAKKGKYGAFMMDRPDELINTVQMLAQTLEGTGVPLLCKIRCYKDTNETVELAKRLEKVGCTCLSIHGRTKEDATKGTPNISKPLADWSKIKAVKLALNIPVIGNGNIRCKADADAMLKECNVDGVMSGIGLLRDPALFAKENEDGDRRNQQNEDDRRIELALEYLDICNTYPTYHVCLSKHLQKILSSVVLTKHPQINTLLIQFAAWNKLKGGRLLTDTGVIVKELRRILGSVDVSKKQVFDLNRNL
tara:strand:+ start:42 stop:1145 length:1104 start_codon:yes stop_codon:yes gene_type:complete